jgi:RND family efflux transporter MFP subunit
MKSANLEKLRLVRDETTGLPGSVRAAAAVVLLAALAGGGWLAWSRWLRPAPAVRAWRVPSPGASARSLDASGYLIPQRRAEVATKAAGIVAAVLVEEGDLVREGQALAELASATEKAQVGEAKAAVAEAEAQRDAAAKARDEAEAQRKAAALALAEEAAMKAAAAGALEEALAWRSERKRDYERMKELRATNDVGEAELTRAEAEWKAAEAKWTSAQAALEASDARWRGADAAAGAAAARCERAAADAEAAAARVALAVNRVRQAEIRLEETVIRSPIAGRVTARKIHPGEAASPAGITTGTRGGALFTVADFSSIEAEVDVNESRLADIKPGQAARIAVDAIPSKRYRGELRQIVPTADRTRAVVKVRVKLLDPDAALLPEMGVRVTFSTDGSAPAEAPAIQVPRESVVLDGAGAAVWLVAGGRAARRGVELGAEKEGKVEVRKGLSGGEVLILGSDVPMSEGLKVRAEER